MSMKQHELNIIKNVIEKAEGISVRLQEWALKLHDFIAKELADEVEYERKANEAATLPSADPVTPELGGADLTVPGAALGAELEDGGDVDDEEDFTDEEGEPLDETDTVGDLQDGAPAPLEDVTAAPATDAPLAPSPETEAA